MKKRYLGVLTGLVLGVAAGCFSSGIPVLLLKPWAALGNLLRSWSLRSAQGNAAAWAIVIILSLLPVFGILIARRKRKLTGDWLWLLTAVGVGVGLFLLMNPTLVLHPMLAQSMLAASPELAAMGPIALTSSMLLLSTLVRWVYGLNERRLIRWAQVILVGIMALIAFELGMTVAGRVATIIQSRQAADPFFGMFREVGGLQPADEGISMLLDMIALIPSVFLLWMLDAALTLATSFAGGWFTEETESNAALLAVRARQTLISAVGCMAVCNILTLGMAQLISEVSFELEVPVTELLTSCGAVLLAKMLSAACRVKRDNDLMI